MTNALKKSQNVFDFQPKTRRNEASHHFILDIVMKLVILQYHPKLIASLLVSFDYFGICDKLFSTRECEITTTQRYSVQCGKKVNKSIVFNRRRGMHDREPWYMLARYHVNCKTVRKQADYIALNLVYKLHKITH